MIKNISVTELKEMLDSNTSLIMVDVREKEEWDDVRIPGAQLMPISNFMEEKQKLNDKNAKIVLICRSGPRSLRAADILEEEGYSDINNLVGGVMEWMDEGFDIEG